MQLIEKIPPVVLEAVLESMLDREISALTAIVDRTLAAHLAKKPPQSVRPPKKREAFAGV